MTISTSNMVAPSPGQMFIGLPSGTVYVADQNGKIANVSGQDVVAMLDNDCVFAQPTGTGGGSQIILVLSEAGITSDATNGLEYGVTAPSGSTGQEAAIQTAINNAVTLAQTLGVAGVKIVWDVAVALGAEIYLSSNMTIEAPNYACGAIMRANAKTSIFRVQGSQLNMGGGANTGSYTTNTQNSFGQFNPAYSASPNAQWYRVFNPAYVNANNIAIIGGTWNGNSPQQSPRGYGTKTTPPTVTNNNIGWPCIMDFRGVNGLYISKIRGFLGLQFGLYFVNCANVVLDEPDIDNINDNNYDNDCIHFNGPCQHIRINSPRVHCADDCIAINADDANFSSQGLISGVTWACSGAITDVRIKDAVVWQGRQNAISWGAICFRSTVASIDDVIVDGFTGLTADWAIWAPQFTGGAGMLIPGPGNIGRVTLDNISIDLQSPQNSPCAIAWGLNTESLVIRNRYRRNAQAEADIFIAPGVTVDLLDVLEYDAYQPAGASNNTQPAVFVTGTVKSLRMTGRSLRDASIAASAAPMLRVGYYTSAAGAFPNTGPGNVYFAIVDVDAEGITNVVDVTNASANIGTLILRGAHRAAAGGSPLANAGAVATYIVGSGVFPLTYSAGTVASYTGTAPVNINTYSDSGTATLETPALAVAGGNLYIQGTYSGSAPASGTASINSGSSQTISGFTAASGFWYGYVTAPAASNSNTISVTLSNGGNASPLSVFATVANAVLAKAQFIPGTTGFASTLGAYTGSSNGDVNNAWNVTATGGTTTPLQPTITSTGGGFSQGPGPHGNYYHQLTNINAHPAIASGWKWELNDVNLTNDNSLIAIQIYSDNVQTNCFQCSVGFNTVNFNYAFANVVGGTTTAVSGASGSVSPISTVANIWLISDGTTITLYVNGTAMGTCPTSAINTSLVSNSACTYVGWTALSTNSGTGSTTLQYSASSFSFGY